MWSNNMFLEETGQLQASSLWKGSDLRLMSKSGCHISIPGRSSLCQCIPACEAIAMCSALNDRLLQCDNILIFVANYLKLDRFPMTSFFQQKVVRALGKYVGTTGTYPCTTKKSSQSGAGLASFCCSGSTSQLFILKDVPQLPLSSLSQDVDPHPLKVRSVVLPTKISVQLSCDVTWQYREQIRCVCACLYSWKRSIYFHWCRSWF